MSRLLTAQRSTDLTSWARATTEDIRVLSLRPVYAPLLYVAALSLDDGPRLLLVVLLEAEWKHRAFAPTQARLGEVLHRDARTVRRWVRALKRRRLIYVKRRGRGLSNVYHVHRSLWDRLAGRRPVELPRELQRSLWKIGLRIGVGRDRMRAAGIDRTG